MSQFEIQIDSRVAELRNEEPFIYRFSLHRTREVEINKLYWAYSNQAYWLIEAAKHAGSVYCQARLFGKAAYAMRQAVQVKKWEEIINKKEQTK